MHPAHLSRLIDGPDALPLACLAADHAVPPEIQPFVLMGVLADLERMPLSYFLPLSYLFAVRDAGVWRVISARAARRAWRTGHRVAFWPLPNRPE